MTRHFQASTIARALLAALLAIAAIAVAVVAGFQIGYSASEEPVGRVAMDSPAAPAGVVMGGFIGALVGFVVAVTLLALAGLVATLVKHRRDANA